MTPLDYALKVVSDVGQVPILTPGFPFGKNRDSRARIGRAAMTKRPQTALVGLRVRMREPLRKRLEVAAKKRGVSLNAELIARLEQSFQIESFEEVAEAQR